MRNNKGAATQYNLEDLKSPSKWKFVENAKYIYVCGFILKENFHIVKEIYKHALENNKVRTFVHIIHVILEFSLILILFINTFI